MPTIAIFGVSGRTGHALVAAARARGWGVRGHCRVSSTPPPGVVVIRGEFQLGVPLTQVLEGADVVCCAIGTRPPYVDVFCAAATRVIVATMDAARCRRLLCVTGASVGAVTTRSGPMRWMHAWFGRRRPAAARDREEQEAVVMNSGLDWTIVKPPRLTSAGASGRIAAGPDLTVGLRSSISRADLATFLMDEIVQPRFVHQRILVMRGS